MKELIGRTILKIFISDDQRVLKFETTTGVIAYEALADCCSESWFADITGLETLIERVVLEVDEVDTTFTWNEDGRSRQESDQIYAYRVKTVAGMSEFIFRNSSNGYYGGSLALVKDILMFSFMEIQEDWRA